ncbi:DUF1614 domain-containing protein [bacterium]|nr:DUF1614 domain-containing protein [bacterium]
MPIQSPERSPILILFTLALALTVVLLEIGAIAYAYERIGIDSRYLISLLALSLMGSGLNLPLARYGDPDEAGRPANLLAINVGGALIPTGLSLYLLARGAAPPIALLAVALVALVVHRIARPLPGIGIAVPVIVPPLIAACGGLLLAPHAAPAVAYVAGSLGTLIGADLTHLGTLRRLGGPVASIGGAGTFDGIFVTGILAVLLA